MKHIVDIMTSVTSKGFSGKTTEMSAYSDNHRTTISHFLCKGKWEDERLANKLSTESHVRISQSAQKKNSPIFIELDDTANQKKKPSSQAKKPMEGGAFVYSHLLGKTVWGHQAMAALVSDGDTSLCYKLELCGKDGLGKIKQAIIIAESLPVPERPGYALIDSWYTCPDLIDAFSKRGYHTIGALKTNRIIYPQGIHISISEFASAHIRKSDSSLVTVGKDKYWMYRYEGKLNKIANAVVLISYPEGAFGNPKALRAFLCTDTELDTPTILQYYRNRWDIEVFFKQQKNIFGFGGYQIRSAKGIERFWLILSLASFYCIVSRSAPLGEAARDCRTVISYDYACLIYCAGRDGIPFDAVRANCIW